MTCLANIARNGFLCGSFLLAMPEIALAGSRPQVDLSVDVTTQPVPFVPGGHATVTLTVHNAGPDTAGTPVTGQDAIEVYEDAFIITEHRPPFEIPVQGIGCTIDTFVTEPLPDGNIALVYTFDFGPIEPGESRVCTYGIDFHPSTRASFATGWRVAAINDEDTDPSNDRFDYVFQAPPASIPAMTWRGVLSLVAGLLFIGCVERRRRRCGGARTVARGSC